MKIKPNQLAAWNKGLEVNKDPYGARIYSYAEEWANLMEARMAKGEKIVDMAKATGHEADTDGITGFMYGAAVSILSHAWEHGEELRLWRNGSYGKSGEKANKSGGVINPAILTIGEEE